MAGPASCSVSAPRQAIKRLFKDKTTGFLFRNDKKCSVKGYKIITTCHKVTINLFCTWKKPEYNRNWTLTFENLIRWNVNGRQFSLSCNKTRFHTPLQKWPPPPQNTKLKMTAWWWRVSRNYAVSWHCLAPPCPASCSPFLLVLCSAPSVSQSVFTITEKDPTPNFMSTYRGVNACLA